MEKVLKVYTLVQRGTRNAGHFVADLVFVDGVPMVVFEWEGEEPAVMAELDPSRLHELKTETYDYMYELPVDDPRAGEMN